MAHPMNEHKAHKVERERVSKMTAGCGRARGGMVHDDAAADRALIRKEVKSSALKSEGGKSKRRADKSVRRAKGGRVKGDKSGKTNINIIVAPSSKPMDAPMAGAALPTPPAMPPRPPMAAMPPTPAMAPPQAGLGGLPPRATGGKVVGKKSLADKKGVTGIGDRTPIQHSGNKSDTQNIGRGPAITRATGGSAYRGDGPFPGQSQKDFQEGKSGEGARKSRMRQGYATGGPIYSNGKPGTQMAPKLPAGSGSGVARKAKAHMVHGKMAP